jgi:hypothetical protein
MCITDKAPLRVTYQKAKEAEEVIGSVTLACSLACTDSLSLGWNGPDRSHLEALL